jgi:hypothetical protein
MFLVGLYGMGYCQGGLEAKVGLPVAVEGVVLRRGGPPQFLGYLSGGPEDLELSERTHPLCREVRESWQGGSVILELTQPEREPLAEQGPHKRGVGKGSQDVLAQVSRQGSFPPGRVGIALQPSQSATLGRDANQVSQGGIQNRFWLSGRLPCGSLLPAQEHLLTLFVCFLQ